MFRGGGRSWAKVFYCARSSVGSILGKAMPTADYWSTAKQTNKQATTTTTPAFCPLPPRSAVRYVLHETAPIGASPSSDLSSCEQEGAGGVWNVMMIGLCVGGSTARTGLATRSEHRCVAVLQLPNRTDGRALSCVYTTVTATAAVGTITRGAIRQTHCWLSALLPSSHISGRMHTHSSQQHRSPNVPSNTHRTPTYFPHRPEQLHAVPYPACQPATQLDLDHHSSPSSTGRHSPAPTEFSH